jgi:hypothetical protein
LTVLKSMVPFVDSHFSSKQCLHKQTVTPAASLLHFFFQVWTWTWC